MSFLKSEETKRKLAVKLSFISLIVGTTASLAVSVFAFSASASLLQISDLNVSTISSAKISLGLKNPTTGEIDYYDQLTSDSYTSSNQTPIEGKGLYPVSSSFLSQWYTTGLTDYTSVTPKFTKEYSSNGEVGFPGFDGIKHYIQTEIFVKQEDIVSRGVNLYLGDLTVKAAHEVNKAKAQALNKENSALNVTAEDLDEIVSCLRFSILTPTKYYIIDPSKEGTTTLAGKLNIIDGNEYYDTFGENYGSEYTSKEALYGEYTGDISKLVYSSASLTDSALADSTKDPSCFNAKTKAGIQALDIARSSANGVELKDEVSYTVDELKYSSSKEDNELLLSLEPGETKRIVISYYIEGWDLDCTDVVQYASFTSGFTLTGQYKHS